ncbi:hypothetical protein BH11PLA2_BH11PLA2_32610 [soil metagenome]
MTGEPTTETVRIDEITRDERFRFRDAYTADALVDQYAADMEDGWGEFPAVKLLRLTEEYSWQELVPVSEERYAKVKNKKQSYKAGTLLLIAGFTRIKAALQAEINIALAVIHEGTWEDALKLAWPENGRHGRRRSDDDLKMVFISMHTLPSTKDKSEREMAVLAGCHRSSVNRFRKEWLETLTKIQSKPSANPTTPSLLRSEKLLADSWGREVPESLVEYFRVVPAAKKITQSLREIAAKVISLKYGSDLGTQCQEPGLERFDVRELGAVLMEWADVGEASLPFLVCPEPGGCDGECTIPDPKNPKKMLRCEQCVGRGYLLRHETDRLPPEAERSARAAA